MSLQIVYGPPPIEIYEGCQEMFAIRGHRGIIWTVGDKLYNPDRYHIEPWLLRHEEVHSVRQLASGSVNAWWSRYLIDVEFRFDEELAAHKEEWRAIQEQMSSRQQRRKQLAYISSRLSGPIYGHMVSKDRAKALITSSDNG